MGNVVQIQQDGHSAKQNPPGSRGLSSQTCQQGSLSQEQFINRSKKANNSTPNSSKPCSINKAVVTQFFYFIIPCVVPHGAGGSRECQRVGRAALQRRGWSEGSGAHPAPPGSAKEPRAQPGTGRARHRAPANGARLSASPPGRGEAARAEPAPEVLPKQQ